MAADAPAASAICLAARSEPRALSPTAATPRISSDVAVGWTANTAVLSLASAGVETDARGFVRVDAHLRTSALHFAAGDVTGRMMLVPPALQDGFVAATNAVRGPAIAIAAGMRVDDLARAHSG